MKKSLLLLFVCLLTFGATAQTVNVTFNLNMKNEEVSPDGVYIAGGGTFGVPGDFPMMDPDKDSIYSITVQLPENSSTFYTFANGNCPDFSCKEDISGQACANPANFNDRFLEVGTDDVTINTCFSWCSDDGSCRGSGIYSATFQVDLSEYAGSFTQPYLSGALNGWSGNANPLTDMGNGIWATTVNLDQGDYEYSFTLDNWAAREEFAGGEPCTITNGGFTQRFLSITQDTTLDAVCWNSCTICTAGTVGTNNLVFDENLFTIIPTLATESTTIFFNEFEAGKRTVRLINTLGETVQAFNLGEYALNHELDLKYLISGVYFVNVQIDNKMATKRIVVK
jgi:hypothetical protein